MLVQRQPALLIMGSSRVYAIPPLVADDPAGFYNAWVPGMEPSEALLLLSQLSDEALPEVIVWAMDQRFFAEGYPRTIEAQYTVPSVDLQGTVRVSISSLLDVASALRARVIGLDDLRALHDPDFGLPVVGVDALLGRQSFRDQGQVFSSRILIDGYIERGPEALMQDRYRAFSTRGRQYVVSAGVDPEAVREVEAVLRFAHGRGVQVVGFLPAFSPLAWGWIEGDGDQFAYLGQIGPLLAPVFEQFGYPFFDLTVADTFGLSNAAFVDDYHLTPYASVQLYRELLRRAPGVLGQYSSAERLDALLAANADDPFLLRVFGLADGLAG